MPICNLFKNRYPLPKMGRKKNELLKKLDEYDIKRIIVNTRFHLTSIIGVRYGIKKNIPVYLKLHN